MKRNVPILEHGAAVDAQVGLLEVRTDYLGLTLSSLWSRGIFNQDIWSQLGWIPAKSPQFSLCSITPHHTEQFIPLPICEMGATPVQPSDGFSFSASEHYHFDFFFSEPLAVVIFQLLINFNLWEITSLWPASWFYRLRQHFLSLGLCLENQGDFAKSFY